MFENHKEFLITQHPQSDNTYILNVGYGKTILWKACVDDIQHFIEKRCEHHQLDTPYSHFSLFNIHHIPHKTDDSVETILSRLHKIFIERFI